MDAVKTELANLIAVKQREFNHYAKKAKEASEDLERLKTQLYQQQYEQHLSNNH